jgi:hypothetical protein
MERTKIPAEFNYALRRQLMIYYKEDYFLNCIMPTINKFDLPIEVIQTSNTSCIIILNDNYSLSCCIPSDIYLPISYWDRGKYAAQREIVGSHKLVNSQMRYDTSLTDKKGFGIETLLIKDGEMCYCEEIGYENINRFFSNQSFYDELSRLLKIDWDNISTD